MARINQSSLYYRRLEEARKTIIMDALAKTNGNVVAAAEYLGIDYGGLYGACHRLGIDHSDLKRRGTTHQPVVARAPVLSGWLGQVAPEIDDDDE
jgi:hypothetical protein